MESDFPTNGGGDGGVDELIHRFRANRREHFRDVRTPRAEVATGVLTGTIEDAQRRVDPPIGRLVDGTSVLSCRNFPVADFDGERLGGGYVTVDVGVGDEGAERGGSSTGDDNPTFRPSAAKTEYPSGELPTQP
jgi:hypothetical protein